MSVILGIHGGHDGSACIVQDGRLIANLASERLTRSKKSGGVPRFVLDAVLKQPEAEEKATRLEAVINDGMAGAELYNWERTGPAKEDR